jgi:hypothetical protein
MSKVTTTEEFRGAWGHRVISPELALALTCCRDGFASNDRCGDHLTSPNLDWATFLRLIRFHRIEGLAWNYLARHDAGPPLEEAEAIKHAAWRIAAQNLQAVAECRALLQQFEAAKVPLLFLKGLTLGALAYGNPALKAAIDIDLLIDPADLGNAASLLRTHGYRLIAPHDSPNDQVLWRWHRGWKESVWAQESRQLQIDLHTRMSDNARLIAGIDVHSPRRWVDVANGIRLPTLADEQLFAYLAVHGASSAWFRLKWVSDFAALLHGHTPDAIERLYRRSQELGAGRAAGQALLLADALFGTLKSAQALRGELEGDRATRWLFRIAMRQLTGRREPAEPTERRLGTAAIHLSQFLLLPGIGYKLSEVSRQAGKVLTKRAASRAADAGRGRDGTGPDEPSPQP